MIVRVWFAPFMACLAPREQEDQHKDRRGPELEQLVPLPRRHEPDDRERGDDGDDVEQPRDGHSYRVDRPCERGVPAMEHRKDEEEQRGKHDHELREDELVHLHAGDDHVVQVRLVLGVVLEEERGAREVEDALPPADLLSRREKAEEREADPGDCVEAAPAGGRMAHRPDRHARRREECGGGGPFDRAVLDRVHLLEPLHVEPCARDAEHERRGDERKNDGLEGMT
jgi:hypothetical protein